MYCFLNISLNVYRGVRGVVVYGKGGREGGDGGVSDTWYPCAFSSRQSFRCMFSPFVACVLER